MNWRRAFFTAVVILLAAANVYGFVLGVTRRSDLVSQCPRLETLWSLYLSCPVASLVAFGALWFRRKWGFWLAVVLAAIVFGIELYSCGPAPHIFRVPVATLLLIAAVRPVWSELS